MRRPIGFDQVEVDRYADTATELCQWLEQRASEPVGDGSRRLAIPARLTAIAAILVVYGAPIMMGGGGTEGLCWGGGCHVVV